MAATSSTTSRPDVDVVLAGDCWYEAGLAERVLPWLAARPRPPGSTSWSATRAGATCRPTTLEELATYEVRTTTELEDLDRKEGRVYTVRELTRK